MKTITKLLGALMIGFFSFITVHAQTEIGFYTGLQSGNVTLDGINGSFVPDIKNVQSGVLGLRANYFLDDRLSVSTGLQYTKKGFDIHESTGIDIFGLDVPVGVKVETRINTIEIPLYLRYGMGTDKYKAYVMAGPQITHATSGTIKTFASSIIDIGITDRNIDFSSDTFNKTTLGGGIGFGGEAAYGSGKFFGEFTFQKDFSDFMYENTINASLAHKGYTFKVGYLIAL